MSNSDKGHSLQGNHFIDRCGRRGIARHATYYGYLDFPDYPVERIAEILKQKLNS